MKDVIIYVSYLWINLIPVDYWFYLNFNSVYSSHIYTYKVESKPISKHECSFMSKHECSFYKNSKLYIFNKILKITNNNAIALESKKALLFPTAT